MAKLLCREPALQELRLLSVQKSPYKLNVLFKEFEMRRSAFRASIFRRG